MKKLKIFRLILILFIALVFGYMASLRKSPLISLLVLSILILTYPIIFKKRSISFKSSILCIIFLLFGFLVGKVGFKIELFEESYFWMILFLIGFFIIIGIFLFHIRKEKDPSKGDLGFIMGPILIIMGIFALIGIIRDIINHRSEFILQIFFILLGIVLLFLGSFFFYYAIKIRRKR